GHSTLTGKSLPGKLSQLAPLMMSGKLDAYAEFAAQIEKIIGAGIRPSHLDTHKHTHLMPNVFRAVVRLAKEYSIPYVRLPVDTSLPLAGTIRRYYERMSSDVKTTDHFIGFRLTGRLTEETLAQALLRLPEGTTEFMCHPGRLGNDLATAQTRLKESRVRELEALVSPRIRELIVRQQIRLWPFSA
ncbi:MAG: ChbG/HpnK family deacetylase, partial [Bryobacteraceae bacterium]